MTSFTEGLTSKVPRCRQIIKEFRAIVEKITKTPVRPGAYYYSWRRSIVSSRPSRRPRASIPEQVAKTLESMKTVDTIFGPARIGGQEMFGINHAILRPVIISRIMKTKIETEIENK